MRFILRLLFVLLLTQTAWAEESRGYLPQKADYRILVIGDGLAGGLWSGMARMGENDLNLSVNGRYIEESGLARPEIHDWLDALPKILDVNPADIVVVMVGSNDAQAIRDGEQKIAFGTESWLSSYAKQVDGLLAILKSRGAAVYWVSPPPMASDSYNASVRTISDLQAASVASAGAKWVDIRPALSNADGSYAERGADETGADRKLRSSDGIHFMKAGNNRVAQIVLDAIRADIAAASAAPVPTAPVAVLGEPLFGQDAAPGVQNIAAAAPLSERAVEGAPASEAEAIKVVSGSAAEQLMAKGLVSKAPAGRFDDFSLAPGP